MTKHGSLDPEEKVLSDDETKQEKTDVSGSGHARCEYPRRRLSALFD